MLLLRVSHMTKDELLAVMRRDVEDAARGERSCIVVAGVGRGVT